MLPLPVCTGKRNPRNGIAEASVFVIESCLYATFVRRWRLSRASQLLRTTDTPIKNIARQLGFRHTTHFHSAFTAQFGTTPARYRHHAN